ncbi:hypothetical protein [Amycolatopsis sacchari]|nr:hypothetical protein [Amycolatopsis sacchari]
MRAPLAVAAAVVVLAVGLAVALPRLGDRSGTVAVGSPEDARLVDECVQSSRDELPQGRWRAGARLDLDAENGFLVIRDDEYAAVRVLKHPANRVRATLKNGQVAEGSFR